MYQGKEVKLPFCGVNCSYAEFSGYFDTIYVDNFEELCGLNKSSKLWILLLIEGLLIVLLGGCTLRMYFLRKGKKDPIYSRQEDES